MVLFLLEEHRGKVLGAIIGLMFGLLVAVFNFWKAIFIALCAVAGYHIGKKFDHKGNFKDFWDRIFPE